MSTRTKVAAVETVKIISQLKTALKIKTRLKRERKKDDSEVSNLGD